MGWLGSVDILVTTMKIRDTRSVEIVVCYVGRRDDGRSRTPAFCSHRLARLPGGAPALPKPIQQTPIHAATVAGDPLPDALRGLGLSRGRSAAGRTPRIAPGAEVGERARFHDSVSLPAASGRSNDRSRGRRDGAPAARHAQKRTAASPHSGRCDGLGAGSGQHILCAQNASSRAKTAAVETLVEVGGRGGPGSSVPFVADCATWPLERLCESARSRRSGFPANAHRSGAGRRRIRQREESHLYPPEARGAKCDPCQAREENLAHSWSASRDATSLSATTLPASIPDREPVQFGQAQALGPCPRPLAANAETSSSAARIELQFVSPEA